MRNAPNPLLFPHASVTRRNFPQTPSLLPYLVLLRVGFSLPAELLLPRCALTAPFHPYPTLRRGGIFSVALSVEPLRTRPAVSRPAALWRPDFPLPPPNGTRGSDCPSGSLTRLLSHSSRLHVRTNTSPPVLRPWIYGRWEKIRVFYF